MATPNNVPRFVTRRVTSTVSAIAVFILCGCGNTRDASVTKKTSSPTPQFAAANACIECHTDKVASHRATGHASTFGTTADSKIAKSFCGMSVTDEEPYFRYEYECDAEGLMVKMPRVFGNDRYPLHYTLGSGRNAVTFLSLIPSASGQTVGIEHRWSWFADGNRKGITPGQKNLVPAEEVDYFGMVFKQEYMEKCIRCHTTSFEVRDHALVNLIANVECEACHGPAAKHVELARAKQIKDALAAVSVARPGRDEIQLCGKCHRLPSDIATDRLKTYPRSLVRFQPVGLLQSRCFTASNETLSCSTCHNPHETATAKSTAQYETDCRQCHAAGKSRLCSKSPDQGCVACHMPKIELAPGLHFHDHWIRIRPQDDPALKPATSTEPHAMNPP